jgi:hypothetical protein
MTDFIADLDRKLGQMSETMHRLARERDIIREVKTRCAMGVMTEAEARLQLSKHLIRGRLVLGARATRAAAA